MPKGQYPRKTGKRTPKEVKLLTCSMCQQNKPETDFFSSNNLKLHATGKYPYCKDCLKKECYDRSDRFDIELFKNTLKIIDRPYFHDLFLRSLEENPDNVFGIYMKNLSISQRGEKHWNDSVFDLEEARKTDITSQNKRGKDIPFLVDNDIKEFWGAGYSNEEYEAMQKKYVFLGQNYTEVTNMHTEALVTYVRYKVKEEFAVSAGDVASAKVWSELANKAAAAAKINPNQLSKADLMGGISTISEISQAVEQAVDIIPILPQFKYRPNDAIDFTIWCYINYARDLEGKPLVEYSDVYKFYDDRVNDYISQHGDSGGIFKNNPTMDNREIIEKFIELPSDYSIDDYGDDDE